ncbi:MAG: hypothetical protein J0L67_00005 [Cytophagales bacterium]|nr:hypothetical protein [Cytophagales bacterium]
MNFIIQLSNGPTLGELTNPGTTMKILTEKLGVNMLKSKELVFTSPSWRHLDSGYNPFTEEFLKIAAIDADEVNIVDGKIISVKIDLNKDSDD